MNKHFLKYQVLDGIVNCGSYRSVFPLLFKSCFYKIQRFIILCLSCVVGKCCPYWYSEIIGILYFILDLFVYFIPLTKIIEYICFVQEKNDAGVKENFAICNHVEELQ